MTYTYPAADEVWDVLYLAGAPVSMLDEFKHHWPCSEFRFQGALGFGGKVYTHGGRVWVDCYMEDDTPERRAIIRRTNDALAALVRRVNP